MLPSRTKKELRQIALDIVDNRIFTDKHMSENECAHLLGSVFMPILFGALAPRPVKVKCINDTGEDCLEVDKEYLIAPLGKTDKEVEDMYFVFIKGASEWFLKERFEVVEVIKPAEHVGLVFEYYDKSGPRSINGLPMFMSCQLLNREDAVTVHDMIVPLMEAKQKFLDEDEEG